MSLSLSKFKKYNNDLQKYRDSLTYIQEPKIKEKFTKLIDELEHQNNLIDNAHNSNNNGNINPLSIKENVINACYIRKKLDKLLKDLKRT